VAWTLQYRDRSKTMESTEVDTIHARVLEALKKALPVSIR
jgi:phenylalanyl-tRNA synthetase beta subunit